MAFELGRLLTGRDIPDTNRLVKSAADELLAIGGEGQSIDWVGVSADDLGRFCGDVYHSDDCGDQAAEAKCRETIKPSGVLDHGGRDLGNFQRKGGVE